MAKFNQSRGKLEMGSGETAKTKMLDEYADFGKLFAGSNLQMPYAFSHPCENEVPMFSTAMRECSFFIAHSNGVVTLLTQKQGMAMWKFIESGLLSGARLYSTINFKLIKSSKDVKGDVKLKELIPFFVSLFNGDYATILKGNLLQKIMPTKIDKEKIFIEMLTKFIQLRTKKAVFPEFSMHAKSDGPQ
jgi:hypothetical protein